MRRERERHRCAAHCARSVVITPETTMMKSTKTIATTMDSAVANNAAEAIGVATDVLGSVVTWIAAMKMLMVLVPQMQAQKCRILHACERNAWARVRMDEERSIGGKRRAHGQRACVFVRSS